jgi:protein O-GlcNAc transferase
MNGQKSPYITPMIKRLLKGVLASPVGIHIRHLLGGALRNPVGAKIKVWLKEVLEHSTVRLPSDGLLVFLNTAVSKTEITDAVEDPPVRLPSDGLQAFLNIPVSKSGALPLTSAELANVIRRHAPADTELAKLYANIANCVARGHEFSDLKGRSITFPETTDFIELSIDGLFEALNIPTNDIEKVMLRPFDIVCRFVAEGIVSKRKLSQVYADIAYVMSQRGQPTLAVNYLRRSLAILPCRQTHDRLFHAMMMAPETTNELMLKEARCWANIYAPSVLNTRRFNLNRSPDKRLRIGYVCCFLYHLGTRITHLPLMLGHDRINFEIVVYSDALVEDSIGVADIWRITKSLDDDAFAQLVLDDRIDILVEFNGRGTPNRFDAFALRLAPVQMNFGNFLATTGIPQVDYTLAHSVSLPPEEDCFYTEKVCRLNPMSIDYSTCWPADFFPPIAPPPYRTVGRITFGCFGGTIKLNERLIQAWCEIVKRVEGSRFYLKAVSFSDPATMASIQRLFERCGIAGDRLILEAGSDHRTMLELYGRVDIALDTFPYNSGNTTLETLWQGIPVITLQGSRWASRTGASLLTLGGLEIFITKTWEEYIDMAIRLAADHDLREELRVTIRDRLSQSELFNMKGYVQGLEAAYRRLWREWLEQNSAGESEAVGQPAHSQEKRDSEVCVNGISASVASRDGQGDHF